MSAEELELNLEFSSLLALGNNRTENQLFFRVLLSVQAAAARAVVFK